jgi:hypothetical protein
MLIINVSDVRIAEIPDPKSPTQKIFTLNYLNRQYLLSKAFDLSQLDLAQSWWKHLTEDLAQVCLIVKEEQRYSVWTENISKSVTSERLKIDLDPVFRGHMYALDILLSAVRERLGQKQAESFGKEILASIPTIRYLKDLPHVIALAMRSESIDEYALSRQQLSVLDLEIDRLGRKYLGKNRTKELLGDSLQKLPSRIKRHFQAWLEEQSK